MHWEGRTSGQICQQMKDQRGMAGLGTGEEIIEHMRADPPGPLGLDAPSAVTQNRPYAVTRNPANARLPFQAKSPALAGRCVRLGLISLAGCEVTTVGRIASDH